MAIKIKKKVVTLKAVFIRYLLSLIATFFIVIIFIILFVDLAMKTQFLYPANYSENIIRQEKPVLSSVSEIKENMIPKGCSFASFDKNFNVIKTNMNENNLSEAILYAKGISRGDLGSKRYYFIERPDGSCVLQYYVQMSYNSEWLNKKFPKPESFIYVILVFGCLISTVIVTVIFAKSLKTHLVPLMKATEKIKEQDLNFDIGKSRIKEFNDVLLSISEMKAELKKSLEQQWNLEQTRREQISALAHDIKTPLTIVKGNTELLCDTTLDEEQQSYTHFILKNANQIEQYILLLTKISKTESEILLVLNKTSMEPFIEEVYGELTALSASKQIKTECIRESIPKESILDKELLFRCLMNVMSNAVEYTPKGGLIKFHILGSDKKLRFIITDSGQGFTKEGLKSATKQFYMGDTSRSSKKHFGMGLYIAGSIAKLHKGRLILENSSDTGGGKVIIEVPLL
ncbi:sensor histidine kinase [Clostridium sp.]|uniref:sensor histidine kinase n=1 Tax=Clostridium sp. TaxID=1506 RepID=UPI0032171473